MYRSGTRKFHAGIHSSAPDCKDSWNMNLVQARKGKSFQFSTSGIYLHKAKYNLVHI